MNNPHEAPVIVDETVIMRPRLDKCSYGWAYDITKANNPASGIVQAPARRVRPDAARKHPGDRR